MADQQTGDSGGAGALVAKLGGPRNAALLAAGGTVVLVGLMSYRKKNAAAAGTAAAANTGPQLVQPATADTTAYDMGNAWQSQYEGLQSQITALQNFNSAPPPVPIQTPPPPPTGPSSVSVGHDQPVQEVIDWADTHGYPNFSWSDFWALNPSIGSQGLLDKNGNWVLDGWGTKVTLAQPGFTSAGSASISDDYKGTRTWTAPPPAATK
jgi:hypothetical protein